jgi:hypothetical protein
VSQPSAQSYEGDAARTRNFFAEKVYSWFSRTASRRDKGQDYARDHLAELTNGMDKGKDVFRIVSHSMGSAFAEGIIDVLKDEGWIVDQTVHISAYQGNFLKPNKKKVRGRGTYVVDAQITNDPVTLSSDDEGSVLYGAIPDSDLRVRKKSNLGMLFRHRDLIDNSELWDNLIKDKRQNQKNNSQTPWFVSSRINFLSNQNTFALCIL